MVYMSSTDALAVLEVRVHLPRYIPGTYVFVSADIPDRLIERVEDYAVFPINWRDDLDWTRSIGLKFIAETWSVALSVPSRIVPASRNIVINPSHAQFSQVVIHPPRPFNWDPRLWDRVLETF